MIRTSLKFSAILLLLATTVALGIQNFQTTRPRPGYDVRFRPLLPSLKQNVDVSIRLPQSLKPFFTERQSKLYVSIDEAGADVYDIRIESEKACGGANYCLLGSISGQLRSRKNKAELDTILHEGKPTRLANGLQGYYLDLSDAGSLRNILLWEQGGVIYQVTMYGQQRRLVEIANSMILNSPVNS